MLVSERLTSLICRQVNHSEYFTCVLVVSAKLRACACTAAAFTCKQQVLSDEDARAGWDTGARQIDTLKVRMVLNAVWSVGVRDLENVIAAVHIDSRDAAVGRLHNGQTLNARSAHTEGHAEVEV